MDSDSASEWVTQADLDLIKCETIENPDVTPEDLSIKFQRNALPEVTLGVLRIAKHHPDARLRLDASKYVMDRILGKPGTYITTGDDLPVEAIMNSVMNNIDQMLNSRK